VSDSAIYSPLHGCRSFRFSILKGLHSDDSDLQVALNHHNYGETIKGTELVGLVHVVNLEASSQKSLP
jgi:hypothetical protein